MLDYLIRQLYFVRKEVFFTYPAGDQLTSILMKIDDLICQLYAEKRETY